jgi:hypothetical protein
MFEKFPALTRFSHGWTITEKLDGSNGQIVVVDMALEPCDTSQALGTFGGVALFAGSGNRLLTLNSDNYGFARFVYDNADEMIEKLGFGRHFGEWVGKGVNKRGYDLDQKRFVLFNTHRWTGADLPERVDVVPVLFEGYADNPGAEALYYMETMRDNGSAYAPGFMDPEGIVMRHGPSGTLFKKTFDYDEQGKWAENQARKEAP